MDGMVKPLTDGDGKLAAYYEYDAWGNTMTEAEKTGVDNPYRYSTKEWDEKSGLYYFGARYYYPEIGRWTQRDPAGIVDGLNFYAYVRNGPASYYDPWGRVTDEQIAKWSVCMAIVHTFMDMWYWPRMGVSDEDLERILPGPGWTWKEVINIAAAAACDHFLHQDTACFGEREMLAAIAGARAAADRFRKNPQEAWDYLKSLSADIRRLLGLGGDQGNPPMPQEDGGKPEKPRKPPKRPWWWGLLPELPISS